MFTGRVILTDHVALGTRTVMRGLDWNYFITIFCIFYLEDAVPCGRCQVLIRESTSLVPTEGIRLGVGPWSHASKTKITVFTGRIRTSDPIGVCLFENSLIALRTQFLMLLHIILREGYLEIHFLLGSQDTDLLAYSIIPLKIAFGSILQLERTFDRVLSIGDDCLDMGDYPRLPNVMSARPLVLILFKEDLVLDIMHHDLADHIQCYFLLSENQHVPDCHCELRNLSVVSQLRSFVGDPHLLWLQLLAERVEEVLLKLETSETRTQLDQVLLPSDVDYLQLEQFFIGLGGVEHHLLYTTCKNILSPCHHQVLLSCRQYIQGMNGKLQDAVGDFVNKSDDTSNRHHSSVQNGLNIINKYSLLILTTHISHFLSIIPSCLSRHIFLSIPILQSNLSPPFPMESYILPQLQKSTSVQYKMVEREASPPKPSKFKVGSLPSLPHHNTKAFLLRKHSCLDQYTPHEETAAQRTELYNKVLSLIEDMIGNPSKFQVLLSALSSMENSIKNVRKSKGSIDIKTTTGQKSFRQKFSQRSIEIQISRSKKMANSEGMDSVDKEREGCGGDIIVEMAESIELECPYDGLMGVDKISLAESEELKFSHLSAARSIQEEMLESLHFPDLPDMYRRISLLLVEEEQEAVSELCSSGSSASPQFPILPLGLPLVQSFFSEASALLVNLALSLLFKYLLRSGETLRPANAGWLLGVSALVAYKIFYDETLQGILEYFGGVLTVGADQAARLERWFLSELNYEVLINNKHYAEIMIKLMSQE